jgi:mycofactocin system glycosyltransferase
LALDPGVRRFADGRIVLGGSPRRLLRLSHAGAGTLDRWIGGSPVGGSVAEQRLARQLLDAGVVHPAPEACAASGRGVTIVIPVRDNAAGLHRLRSALNPRFRVVVVDDGSAAAVPKATVRREVSGGPATARNAGWQRASTALIAFLDSDTVPEREWLDALLPLFDDPAVAAVAPRVRGLPTGWLGRYEKYCGALDMGSAPAAVGPSGRVRYVPSAALVVRRDVLRSVGGFDERLRFGEDVDLVWRLVAAGHTVRYQPDSVVWHQPRPTLGGWLRQRYQYGTSAAALARRHPAALACAYLTGWQAAQYLAVAFGRCGLGAGIGAVGSVFAGARLARRGVPLPVVVSIGASGQMISMRQVLAATRREWWPVALCTRSGRRLLAISWVWGILATLTRGPVGRDAALRIADDLAYGAGVWAGCLRHRTIRPLLPSISFGVRRAR